ncbi:MULTISPECIES: LysR family transcriptional regulator [unclassified Pseudomonas]|uniref:LysR family transcriptional regulator n=1 Tax=unclassified Pseudomonas TaxID=196821 RepID=UPI000BD76011|nr:MULTISPECIES: LysR family transcriptional regulator [unclassified Pseudomonas]PVZ10551.1 DNA-binding transcriptional LysR family regulator [Pseudomonas sp. URIL14HWK12:I12]PVZ21977.1 DNA-binding transcriptional LysR family regulator [Pseudomonas sp. URIL14HWK12:I10]PVZ30940.1 DNA-binding transcriptional LysR family regulator [Pseudomonas sp. URIL14HWK12:I11]SNZ17353.1 DNA-binding transcriptional regulator, LysR family [Pseudomonas sp. URIL14HWK12:I9]
MLTLRQLEALHWIERLGTFERAAQHLHTTQSAISKRVLELEQSTGLQLFDRSQRGARLTAAGEEILVLGRQMLVLAERIGSLKEGNQLTSRRLRLGVTELTALTWLPRLITQLVNDFPGLTVEPEVDMSRHLHERLMDDLIDLIIIPDTFTAPEVTSVPLATVENAWMAAPGLISQSGVVSLRDLATYPVLVQGKKSGSGLFVNKWLGARGIELPKTLSSDSLTAMLGLTAAGLGVTYLPLECFKPLVEEGKLTVIQTDPALPPVPYMAMYRNDRPFAFVEQVAARAVELCDFSRQLQS